MPAKKTVNKTDDSTDNLPAVTDASEGDVRDYVLDTWKAQEVVPAKGWFPRLRRPVQSYVAPDVTTAEGVVWATEDIVDLRDRSIEARQAVAALKAELGSGINYDRIATAVVDEIDRRKQ